MTRRQVDKINFERGEQTVLKVTLVTKKYILSFNVPVTNSASQRRINSFVHTSHISSICTSHYDSTTDNICSLFAFLDRDHFYLDIGITASNLVIVW